MAKTPEQKAKARAVRRWEKYVVEAAKDFLHASTEESAKRLDGLIVVTTRLERLEAQ